MRKLLSVVSVAVLCSAGLVPAQEPVLMPGWPIRIDHGSPFTCPLQGITLYDLDSDGDMDLIVGADSVVYAYDCTGKPLDGWPYTVRNSGAHCAQSPVVGDIDGDGLPEVVITTRQYPRGGELYAFNDDGTLCDGFPVELGTSTTQHSLYDLDGDGALEITTGRNDSSPELVKQVKVFYGNGEMFPGWPVNGVWSNGIAVGDIDNDDDPEIVVSAGLGKIFAFERHGEIMDGFPIELSPGGEEYFAIDAPVLFDLNGDDTLEIGQLYGEYIGYFIEGSIGVFDMHGNELHPWPLYFGEDAQAGVVYTPLESGGELFAAFGASRLYYFLSTMEAQYAPGWPYYTGEYAGNYDQPVIGDIDGDGSSDIIFNFSMARDSIGSLFAFHRSGEPLEYFPLEVEGVTFPGNASLADVDDDGIVELALAVSVLYLPYLDLYLFKIQDVPYIEERFPWPMSCHDPQHTNNLHYRYQTGVPHEHTHASVAKLFMLSQNYPNPFNPTTEIRYFLPRDSDVRVEIYNTMGARLATLVERRQTAGYKSVRWNSGEFASGIYFYRLAAGDFSDVKMMTLLR